MAAMETGIDKSRSFAIRSPPWSGVRTSLGVESLDGSGKRAAPDPDWFTETRLQRGTAQYE